jgi:23S rRNA (guanine745-N1)-methyltransferase
MQACPLTVLMCPLDGAPLQAVGAALRCGRGHTFDVAREGYCNLLAVQHKASLDPGDSKEMVAARRRVLEAQHYAPIAEHVFAACIAPLAMLQARPLRVVDAGCGEGYYLERIADLAQRDARVGALDLAGIDVSKWAVKAAAKRKAPATWLVANNRQMPFPPGSVDVILCLFGFAIWDGFKSTQVAGQQVVLVDPGLEHLLELRQVIYPVVQRSPAAPLTAAMAAGYRLVRDEPVRFTTHLPTAQMIQDVTAMTPHAHRMPQAGREALAALTELTVTVDVSVRTLVLGS